MKRWILTLGAAALLVLPAGRAFATGPMMDWDPAYFYFPGQPGVTASNQPPGSIMRCVGTISLFGPPLEFLNPSLATTEYTFTISDMTAGATNTFVNGSYTVWQTPYTGGVITVYRDPTPDAVFAPNPENAQVPSTFVDNDAVLLVGNFTGLTVTTNNFTAFQVGSIEGDIVWTGGTLIELLGNGGPTCPGLFTGGSTWNTAPGIGIPGYLFRHDGKIDLQCPTPAQKSSWGRLKNLYR